MSQELLLRLAGLGVGWVISAVVVALGLSRWMRYQAACDERDAREEMRRERRRLWAEQATHLRRIEEVGSASRPDTQIP